MIYPINIIGSPVLRKVAEDIDQNYPNLTEFIENLKETMYETDGLGLAAPQVGKSVRIFCIDGSAIAEDYPELADFKRTFINAHIVEKSEEMQKASEGCLSIPGIHEEVDRHFKVRIKYHDENWQEQDETLEGMAAVILQHEYDHLDGVLFTDKIAPLRKILLKKKLERISKGDFERRYKFKLGGK